MQSATSPQSHPKKQVLIVGAGPAGCACGLLLARAGLQVTLMDRGTRPSLVVGESLIPSTILRLRSLELEQAVAAIGKFKPGAAIACAGDFDWHLAFQNSSSDLPTYAYNVPRQEFDLLLQQAARAAGCSMLTERAVFGRDAAGELTLLAPSNLSYDFLIDASGRARLAAKALAIGEQRGARDDSALFSHFNTAALPYGGAIHMTVFEQGWSWRIPLRDRVSVGFVLRPERDGRKHSPAERYQQLARSLPIVAESLQGATQLEDVYQYRNYQLISQQMYGAGWAMLGDAAGFVDPVFSSGLALTLDGAFLLADALTSARPDALSCYQAEYSRRIRYWQELVDTFYDGRFFSLIRHGLQLKQRDPKTYARLEPDARVAAMVSGHALEDPQACARFYRLLALATPDERICA